MVDNIARIMDSPRKFYLGIPKIREEKREFPHGMVIL
jgi:hypothetical protein